MDWHRFFWVVLYPLSCLWAAIALLRRKLLSARKRPGLQVWSIGNIHCGGSGKTPLVLELARRFSSRRPVILLRGYGGSLSGVGALVDPQKTRAFESYGDEAVLLAQRSGVPVLVGRDRKRNVQKVLEERLGETILLDDGFQHVKLGRHLEIVVIQAGKSLEALHCLPLGELRDPICALNLATAIVLNVGPGDDLNGERWRELLRSAAPNVPTFLMRQEGADFYDGEQKCNVEGSKWGAFCGVGHPEGFRKHLQPFQNVVFARAFRDHQTYGHSEVQWLIEEAGKRGWKGWITTEKDYVKLLGPWAQDTGSGVVFSGQALRLLTLRIRYTLEPSLIDFIEGFKG